MFRQYAIGALAVAGAMLSSAGGAKAQAGKCSNAAITTAYVTTILRPANGSGTTGECNPALYGGYSSQQDLNRKVVAYANAHGTNGPVPKQAAAPSSGIAVNVGAGTLHDPSVGTVALKDVVFKDQLGNIMTPSQVAAIVAQGGGNIVAQGGGNITGQRTLSSVGSAKRTYVLVRK